MKAMNFQDDFSIPIDNYKNHCALVFDLTSMQDSTENCHYPEPVREQLRLDLNFTFPLEYDTELIVLGNDCLRLQLTSVVLLEKISKMDNVSLQQTIIRIPRLKYRYLGSSPSDNLPTLDDKTFAIINTQTSFMQGEHWIMIANSRQNLLFADSLGRGKYSFLKQHCKQMMPQALQSHPSVCGFYKMNAAFHRFDFPQEEITGGHDVYLLFYKLLHVIFQSFHCKCAGDTMSLLMFIHFN